MGSFSARIELLHSYYGIFGGGGGALRRSGEGTTLQIGRSRVRFPIMSLEFFRSHYGPGFYSSSKRNEYQVYFLEVKATGA
jgi:hypothetical protein